jgi:hypothetical protein
LAGFHGALQLLFRICTSAAGSGGNYNVGEDGKRILIYLGKAKVRPPLVIIENGLDLEEIMK